MRNKKYTLNIRFVILICFSLYNASILAQTWGNVYSYNIDSNNSCEYDNVHVVDNTIYSLGNEYIQDVGNCVSILEIDDNGDLLNQHVITNEGCNSWLYDSKVFENSPNVLNLVGVVQCSESYNKGFFYRWSVLEGVMLEEYEFSLLNENICFTQFEIESNVITVTGVITDDNYNKRGWVGRFDMNFNLLDSVELEPLQNMIEFGISTIEYSNDIYLIGGYYSDMFDESYPLFYTLNDTEEIENIGYVLYDYFSDIEIDIEGVDVILKEGDRIYVSIREKRFNNNGSLIPIWSSVILCLDLNYNVLWDISLQSDNALINDIIVDDGNSFFAIGEAQSDTTEGFVFAFNLNGDENWGNSFSYDSNQDNYLSSGDKFLNDNFVFCGATNSNNPYDQKAWLIGADKEDLISDVSEIRFDYGRLQVFPNPIDGFGEIKGLSKIDSRWTIVDVCGEVVLKGQGEYIKYSLPKGVYLLFDEEYKRKCKIMYK